jgi:hypothetical protein
MMKRSWSAVCENAGPIGKTAFGIAQICNGVRSAVQDAYPANHVSRFLTVSPDILYRGSADTSGDAAQAFDPRKIPVNAALNQQIPFFAGCSRYFSVVMLLEALDA